MQKRIVLKDETKATSQHQITIPKKIWEQLHLKVGLKFQVVLTDRKEILVTPKWEDVDLSAEEWDELVHLAHAKANVSGSFHKTSDALRYLDKL